MKVKYIILSILIIVATGLTAQDRTSAFRFSQDYPVGTARFVAMGGAFGAVGADFTSSSVNPAGIGLYRSSEFTFTPAYQLINVESNFNGYKGSDQATNLSIANLGLVTPFQTGNEHGLISTTLAFGYNGLNNFSSNTMMQAINENSSLLDNFTLNANENNELDIFYEDLAFETLLMPYDTIAGEYWHDLENVYGQEQIRTVEKSGYKGEYTFSAAMNINHQLYVGATMGVHVVRFNENIYHEETDINDLDSTFNSFTFKEYNSTNGYGIGLKIGILYKPVHSVRLGVAFHGPVVYGLTDDKFTEMDSYWDAGSGISDSYASSDLWSYEYSLRSPYRASASAAFLIGSYGLISAEYEYIDYSTADLNSVNDKFIRENRAISEDFTVAHNLKSGVEIKLNSIYLRGGFQYYSNPFADKRNGSDRFVYSGGIGFRSNQTFIDLAYSYGTRSELYGLYDFNPDAEGGFEKSINSYRKSNLMVTLGYNF
ncbi:MAG TPA: outer membrane protein transport protein [Bacteroidales bacterium]|nr:outer membrane protein transport protein [Bacteroidales bacterium]